MSAPSHPTASSSASVASWLGVLFVLVVLLVAAGGVVRLSGSGLSIPDWPIIHIGKRDSLLPPLTTEGWKQVFKSYERDQERLALEIRSGNADDIGSLGHEPADMGAFRSMFLIEWTHRFLAALCGVVAAGCLVVVIRRLELRERIGPIYGLTCLLIIFQAAIGGLLVKSGTATHWLFLHLGTAALILALIVWEILTLVRGDSPPPDPVIRRRRRPMVFAVTVALAAAWLQIILGALVAGSRGDSSGRTLTDIFSSSWPDMAGSLIPPHLWDRGHSLSWNLLDNAWLLQWLHRWFAFVVVAAVLSMIVASMRVPIGPRLRLSMRVCATFIGVQVILGLANILLTHPLLISLCHLLTAMFLVSALVLAWFDIRFEPPLPAEVADLASVAGGAL